MSCDCHSCESGDAATCYGCPVHGAWCDWSGEGPNCKPMDARQVLAQHTTSDYTVFECHCDEGFCGPAEAWADHVIEALARAGYQLRAAGEGLPRGVT